MYRQLMKKENLINDERTLVLARVLFDEEKIRTDTTVFVSVLLILFLSR